MGFNISSHQRGALSASETPNGLPASVVNSVCPGYVATELNNHSGPGTAADGAIAIVKYAQIGEEGPTAGFFHKDGEYGW